MTCKQFDVVVVPFPFTDTEASKRYYVDYSIKQTS